MTRHRWKKRIRDAISLSGFVITRTATVERLSSWLADIEDSFISQCQTIVHVGAHRGEESERYHAAQKSVIWVEAVPEYARALEDSLRSTGQTVICALAGATDGAVRKLLVAGSLSSTLRLSETSLKNGLSIDVEEEIEVRESRLDTTLGTQVYAKPVHLVVDVQGSELPVLLGAPNLLADTRSILVEISTGSRYDGGTDWDALKAYLRGFDFFPLWEPPSDEHLDMLFYRGHAEGRQTN